MKVTQQEPRWEHLYTIDVPPFERTISSVGRAIKAEKLFILLTGADVQVRIRKTLDEHVLEIDASQTGEAHKALFDHLLQLEHGNLFWGGVIQ